MWNQGVISLLIESFFVLNNNFTSCVVQYVPAAVFHSTFLGKIFTLYGFICFPFTILLEALLSQSHVIWKHMPHTPFSLYLSQMSKFYWIFNIIIRWTLIWIKFLFIINDITYWIISDIGSHDMVHIINIPSFGVIPTSLNGGGFIRVIYNISVSARIWNFNLNLLNMM